MAIGKGDLKDGQGRSALHYAVAYDRPEAVRALLQSGFDVDAAEAEGNTSLHYAAGYGREACVRMLLEAGANVALKNGKGQTPAEVVRGEPRNPLNQNASLLAVLDGTAELATIQQ
jgi:ankyrin repeat protein